MVTLLYIQVGDISEIAYQNPFTDPLKKNNAPVIACDLDNHSEKMVIDHGLKLVRDADKVILYFAIRSQQALGGLQKIISVLPSKKREYTRIILSHHYPLLEQLGRRLGEGVLSVVGDNAKAREQMLEFIGNGS